jgi:hypothetical protein
MPGYNGTGPMGAGPRTGGGFGYCDPGMAPPDAGGRGLGRRAQGRGFAAGFRRGAGGFGQGRGRGYFCRRWSGSPGFPRADRSLLEEEAAALRARLASVERRLAGLETPSEEPSDG